MRPGCHGGGDFPPDRVIGIGDAQASTIVGRGEQLRCQQQQEDGPGLDGAGDLIAPVDAAAQVVLVEKHLRIAEQGA